MKSNYIAIRREGEISELEKRYDIECGEEARLAEATIAAVKKGSEGVISLNELNEFCTKRSLARFKKLVEIFSYDATMQSTSPDYPGLFPTGGDSNV